MRKFSVEEGEEAFCPRTKLFLSADIVGSTAFKQPFNIYEDDPSVVRERWRFGESDELLSTWPEVIQDFYSKLAGSMAATWRAEYKNVAEEHNQAHRQQIDAGEDPRVWKTLGDEIIFWKEISSDLQIWMVMSCWLKVITEVRNWIKGKSPKLDIKCSAWTAEFPVRNRAVWMPKNLHNHWKSGPSRKFDPVYKKYHAINQIEKFYSGDGYEGIVDFIGPSMDTGFRISTWSTPQRMAVSLDVAYLLAVVEHPPNGRESPTSSNQIGSLREKWFHQKDFIDGKLIFGPRKVVNLNFSDPEPLKGVIGGAGYPKFWLKVNEALDSSSHLEGILLRRPEGFEMLEIIRDYAVSFYNEKRAYLFPAFINCQDSVTDICEGYGKFWAEIVAPYSST